MKILLLLITLTCFLGTNTKNHLISKRLPQTTPDTINHINELVDKAVFKSPGGKYFNVHFEPETETENTEMKTIVKISNGTRHTVTVANQLCDNGNKFDGVYRAGQKESYITPLTAFQTPANISSLLSSLTGALTTGIITNSPRISAERKNIQLTAFLYAIKRESDEDYHIIIGSSQTPSAAVFFNVECAGLPATGSAFFMRLNAARQQLVAFLNSEICKNGYTFFDDHPKVRVRGSLFYDKQHENSIVGPPQCKPKTAWELHPITDYRVL